jgi:hypothetical protein
MTRCALSFICLSLLPGCGTGRPEADVERGRRAVVAALDAWKANEPPAKLKALPDPVEFAEELRATHTLADYTLGKVDTSDKEVIRYTVTLKLKDKKGKLTDREAVYAVALKTPVVVTRDPYY